MKKFLLLFLSYHQAEGLKSWLARILYWSGAAWVSSLFLNRGAAILMYHSVRDDASFADNRVRPASFAAHLEYLSRRRKVVPLKRLVDALAAGESIPNDWVVLTFDDGYKDNCMFALPILARHQASATFFICLDAIDRRPFFYDVIQAAVEAHPAGRVTVPLPRGERAFFLSDGVSRDETALQIVLALRALPTAERDRMTTEVVARLGGAPFSPDLYLYETDIAALSRAGQSIGSHTLHHPNLAALTRSEQDVELSESRRRLERAGGMDVLTFAFPYGKYVNFGEDTKDALRAAGYRCAVITEHGRVHKGADPFALPRIGVRDDLVRLKVALMGIVF